MAPERTGGVRGHPVGPIVFSQFRDPALAIFVVIRHGEYFAFHSILQSLPPKDALAVLVGWAKRALLVPAHRRRQEWWAGASCARFARPTELPAPLTPSNRFR